MAMSDWQLIETAPKDGTRVLLFNGQDVKICRWTYWVSGKFNQKTCRLEDFKQWIWNEDDAYYTSDFREPTHWMPLPNPPHTAPHTQDGSQASD